jgi:hypothetical protein
VDISPNRHCLPDSDKYSCANAHEYSDTIAHAGADINIYRLAHGDKYQCANEHSDANGHTGTNGNVNTCADSYKY